jgi:ureidoglycolate lyase
MRTIPIEPLTKARFAPYGDVVEIEGTAPLSINQGFAERVDRLAQIDVGSQGGEVNISIFTALARPRPIAIEMVERHPLGTQLFYPLQDISWLVLVCDAPQDPGSYRAFRASGRQGVNYGRNVWHHPLLVEQDHQRFLVVDRAGPGGNLEESWLDRDQALYLIGSPIKEGRPL